MTWDFLVSADLGQAHDYTAVGVFEIPVWCEPSWPAGALPPEPGWYGAARVNRAQRRIVRELALERGQPSKPPLLLRHIDRVRGERYTRVVDRIADLMRALPSETDRRLVVDYGGVGRAVFDLADQRGLDPAAVTVTGGDRVNGQWPDVRVPKREVIASAQIALGNGRLRIAAGLEHAATLVKELLAFRVKISASGHDSYEGREGEHDDLVMMAAQAVWVRDWYFANIDAATPMAETAFGAQGTA